MDAIGSQPGLKSGDINFASVRLKEQFESTFEDFPFLVRIKDSRGQEFEFGKSAHHWREEPLNIHLKSVKAEKVTTNLDGLQFLELFRTEQIDLSGNLYLLSELKNHLGLNLSLPQLLGQVIRAKLFQFQNLSRARKNVKPTMTYPRSL